MSSLVLTDAKLFISGHDFSGQMNALALDYSADMLDETTFGATTRKNKGGIKSVVGNHQGLWDSASTTAVDPVLFARIGTADQPVVISPDGGDAGDLAYLFRAVHSEYAPGGAVGELLGFSVSMEGSGGKPLVRGRLLHNGAATGNVTGTAFELGTVSATQVLYAALHVFSGTGSFAVEVQSAPNQGFGSPSTRITFTTVATGTPVASEWDVSWVLGTVINDTWWRVVATNPNTRNFAVAVGIQ